MLAPFAVDQAAANPACIAGVRVSLPNRKARCGGFMRRSSGDVSVDADPTAGGQGVQCGGLRRTRVHFVPLAGAALGFGCTPESVRIEAPFDGGQPCQ